MFTILGTVKVKKDLQQVTDTFKKREFVITDSSGNYPQDILFQLTQDRTNLLDDINVNDMVNVSFNLRGREWINPQGEAIYFNSLDVWRIEKAATGGGTPTPSDVKPTTVDNAETLIDEGDDDLPF